MKLISTSLSLIVGLLVTAGAVAGEHDGQNKQVANQAIQAIVLTHQRIENEGFENVLKTAQWPKAPIQIDDSAVAETQDSSDNPLDDCIFDPDMAGCPSSGDGGDSEFSFGGSSSRNNYGQLKNDGVQILATEVLYQTLTYFKVKHVFGQLKDKSWGFAVIDAVPGAPYQDLDTDAVVGAMKQFRKYVVGLLCDDPQPGRVLAMMNRYDVGTRFRWDMAWALLGNSLPDSPNKFMAFGAKWRRFKMAMDGIQSGSLMQIPSMRGGDSPLDPSGFLNSTGGGGQVAGHSSNTVSMGFIAREVTGIIRLAGDIVAGILDLFCVSDLSVNQQKESQKEQAVYKLLDIKKELYDRYSPLRPVLDSLGQQASKIAGRKISFLPN